MSDYSHTRTCWECDGWGRETMLTLDGVEIHTEVLCSRCEGDGVIDVYDDDDLGAA